MNPLPPATAVIKRPFATHSMFTTAGDALAAASAMKLECSARSEIHSLGGDDLEEENIVAAKVKAAALGTRRYLGARNMYI